jgi:ElaB/YqjD/DUF883 family membrane-anchored ribosome-binding protein
MHTNSQEANMQVTTDKLMQDLRAVVGDAEELLKATAGQTGERIENIRARAEQSVRNARERMRAAGHDLRLAAETATHQVEGEVRDNPWTTLGVAAGIGVVLGMMLARK